MKKNLHLLLALLCVVSLSACRRQPCNELVKVTYIHKYGVPCSESDWHAQGRDGQIVELTSDGVTATKGYIGGVLDGRATYTYPNSSTLQRKEEYRDGNLMSRTVMYPSGIPHFEEAFDGDERSVTFWYEQGTPERTELYRNGFLVQGEYRSPTNDVESRVREGQGVRLEHDHDGSLLAKETVENGEVIERVTLFANGEPSEVIPYQNSLIHGRRLTFSLGGLPASVEEWANGFQEGLTTLYQNGEIVAKIPYVKGKREGVAQLYRNGTDVVEEVSYRADKMHGKRTLFIEEGATKVEWYLEGELVNKLTFDRLNPI